MRENFVLFIGICLCVYFCYHAIAGNRSFLRLYALNTQIALQTGELQDITTRRTALEARVTAMRPGHISRDLLEERARAVLGYIHRNEVVILPSTEK